MKRFEVWLVMKNPENGRVVDNLGLCAIITPEKKVRIGWEIHDTNLTAEWEWSKNQ